MPFTRRSSHHLPKSISATLPPEGTAQGHTEGPQLQAAPGCSASPPVAHRDEGGPRGARSPCHGGQSREDPAPSDPLAAAVEPTWLHSGVPT